MSAVDQDSGSQQPKQAAVAAPEPTDPNPKPVPPILRLLKRLPFTTFYVVLTLVLAVVCTTLWNRIEELSIYPDVAYGLPAFEDGRWLTLRAARMEDSRPARERDIAVSIEDSSPVERASLFCRAYGLSPRDSELLGHLLSGHATDNLSRLMFLSQHTVQDHFKSIFAKTAVRDRRTLLARVLGT